MENLSISSPPGLPTDLAPEVFETHGPTPPEPVETEDSVTEEQPMSETSAVEAVQTSGPQCIEDQTTEESACESETLPAPLDVGPAEEQQEERVIPPEAAPPPTVPPQPVDDEQPGKLSYHHCHSSHSRALPTALVSFLPFFKIFSGPSRSYICGVDGCSLTFRTHAELASHKKNGHDAECPTCGKVMRINTLLYRHKNCPKKSKKGENY